MYALYCPLVLAALPLPPNGQIQSKADGWPASFLSPTLHGMQDPPVKDLIIVEWNVTNKNVISFELMII